MGKADPFQSTIDPRAKPVPLTVSTKAALPAVALVGEMELITGFVPAARARHGSTRRIPRHSVQSLDFDMVPPLEVRSIRREIIAGALKYRRDSHKWALPDWCPHLAD